MIGARMETMDVTALGELLIDLTPDGKNSRGIPLFAANPGGAPANVLAMNARLGGKTAFIGKVGDDAFGAFLRKTLVECGIDASGLVTARGVNTTLAVVQLDERGDRSFSFYRKPGADVTLTGAEVKRDLIAGCRIFHFGAVSLTDEPCRSATLEAAEYAKARGKLVSYDPNYRPLLWKDAGEAKREMLRPLPLADILKVSEEEMELLSGESGLEAGAKKLAGMGPLLVLVSRGPEGAFYCHARGRGSVPAYRVGTVDTTGAGDAFFGAVLYRVGGMTREALASLPEETLRDIVDFANAAGSLTTAKRGAIPAMPTLGEIEACRKSVPHL